MEEAQRFGTDRETPARHEGASLPHWRQDQAVYHVVFRPADSLPAEALARIRDQHDRLARIAADKSRLTRSEIRRLRALQDKQILDLMDSGRGSCVLAIPRIASIVAGALTHFDRTRYVLHAWCVMPNHVHVVVQTLQRWPLSKIVQSWKSFTAHLIVAELSRHGTVWQKEAFDHIVRSEASYRRLMDYVAANPAKAGLRDWQWVWRAEAG